MKSNADAIVKALKCCNVPSGRTCSECPYHEFGAECKTRRNKDAAELIVKLIDENRDLKTDLKEAEEEYESVYEQAEADIRGNMADGGTSCHWCIAGHRADAVRKMQEKIRAKSEYGTINMSTWQLDQIAEELLED